MTTAPGRVLILGGNSSIARHLLTLLSDARSIARTGGGERIAVVGDYRDLRPGDFAGARAVINCVGIVSGGEAALRAVNIDLQHMLAQIAREAGVPRYVAIGSLSVFGPRTRIDQGTPVAPIDAYGRSKLEGERALRALETNEFATVSVAFPAIVGTTRLGKVERMLRLWRRTGIWPVPAGDIARSMIGARSAARVLASAIEDDRTGRVLAADPAVFSYAAASRWLREDVGGRFARLPIPSPGVALLARVNPGLHRSIMADSLLDAESNYALDRGIGSTLRQELAEAVQGKHR